MLFFVAKLLWLWVHFLQHANHNNIVLKFGHFAGLQVQGKTACPICWLQLKYRYSRHLHKTVYVEFREFLSLGHPFRDEVKHFFNGVAELDEPPFRCGAADWKIIWENKMNITNGIFTPPLGMNRCPFSTSWNIGMYWKSTTFLHILKNVYKSLLTHLSRDLDNVSSREDLQFSNTKEILWRPTVVLENGKMVYETAPYVLTCAEQKEFFFIYEKYTDSIWIWVALTQCLQYKRTILWYIC